MGYPADQRRRIERLEDELMARPTAGQVEFVKEHAERRQRLYEAALKRNTILKRRLDEATAKLRDLERQKVA